MTQHDETLETMQFLQELVNDESLFHIIGVVEPVQPGVLLFSTLLEYNYYKPSTERHDLFQYNLVTWANMVLSISSIPVNEYEIVQNLAEETDVSLMPMLPTFYDTDGTPIRQFPFWKENHVATITLPNESMWYELDTDEQQKRIEQETIQCNQIISKHYAWLHNNFPTGVVQ